MYKDEGKVVGCWVVKMVVVVGWCCMGCDRRKREDGLGGGL